MQKRLYAEYEVIGAISLVGLLNITIFTLLHAGKSSVFSLVETTLLYGVFIVIAILLAAIKKLDLLKFPFYALTTVMTLHIFQNLYYLIINPDIKDNGIAILTDAFLIWTASVLVFSLWYWGIDRNGPVARFLDNTNDKADILFLQYMISIKGWEDWKPRFLDYFFFSFFTSSSFAAADVQPLSRRIKVLMMIEALISLVIIGMVASRAITLIQ